MGEARVSDCCRDPRRAIISVNGVVQGVGFRPFIYRLAHSFGLPGKVYNSMAGVIIEVEGAQEVVEAFWHAIETDAPPLADIIQNDLAWADPVQYSDFTIEKSSGQESPTVLVTPDVGICADCAREMADPADRRFGYPFINCTNCGPRFTIVKELPYDRARTTMAPFAMCPECRREYDDPRHRRFHAQPNACPECGPKAFFRMRDQVEAYASTGQGPGLLEPEAWESEDQHEVFAQARAELARGAILAVKGLGGFHLVCDARQEAAVLKLRHRKHREAKPFALMCRDMEAVKRYCEVGAEAEALLTSWRRPIVLLPKRRELAPSIAPGVDTLGVMLAYAPMQLLLFDDDLDCLVATSGNISDSPLVIDNGEAARELIAIADGFLFHNRDIHNRCDDSVTAIVGGRQMVYRRSRGYAPQPLEYHADLRSLLAVGGDQKNTFCLTKGRRFYLSQHIGEIGDLRSYAFYKEAVSRLSGYFQIEPEAVVHDLHPDYRSTRVAKEWFGARGVPLVAVQHHEAHLASCLAEHGVNTDVLGVVCDGTGFGSDGKLWGFEFFAGSLPSFRRVGHLSYTPMPGGEASIRKPSRMLASYLQQAGPDVLARANTVTTGRGKPCWDKGELQPLLRQVELRLNAPETASAGRLFDAVSALVGICREGHYEGQPAIELEAAISSRFRERLGSNALRDERYPFDLRREDEGWLLDHRPLWAGVLDDLERNVPVGDVAARFHHTIATMIMAMLDMLRAETGIRQVALSGGVFQNRYLLQDLQSRLAADGFTAFVPEKIPANDGGISLGQAILGSLRLAQSTGR